MKSSTDLNRSTAPEKKGSQHNPQHNGWPIHGFVPSFSLEIANDAVGKSQASVDNQLLGLLGPYTSMWLLHSILARGINPSVLNRHRWGLQPWMCQLSTSHSATFPTDDLYFPPKGPAWSQVNQSTITKRSKEGTNPKSHEWEPPLDFYRNLSSKYSITNVKPQRDRINKDKQEGQS
jgi:hypothetical protein